MTTAVSHRPATLLLVAALLVGLPWGFAFGVPGGDFMRRTGLGSQGEAQMFWLLLLLVVSLALMLPAATRTAGMVVATVTIAYFVGLLAGHWAGFHWGNFIGWHPD